MTVAFTLAVSAGLVALLSPWVLNHRLARQVGPTTRLAGWLGSAASLMFLLVSVVVVLAWPRHAPAEGVAETVLRCLATATHTITPWVDEGVAALGAASLVLVLARTAVVGGRGLRVRAASSRRHQDVLDVVGRRDGSRTGVVWLAHHVPLAYSIGGRRPTIVVTDGLATHLSRDELTAVLAHERAHIAGHHHVILSCAQALARALPRLTLAARAPDAVATLVELAADRAAARATDARTVRSALTRVAAFAPVAPSAALGLASHALEHRLEALDVSRGLQAADSRPAIVAAGACAVALPVLIATGAVVALTTLVCTVL